jgi:ABC-type transport system involved in multi-copper enzyme maturation permease subunit
MRSLRNLWYLALSTFTEGIRHRALWAIVCLAVLLTMANIFVAQLFSWDLGKVSVEFGLSAVALTGLLLVFFLGMKILTDDLERNRISLIMSRPVAGWHYIVGKFLGLGLILLAAALILGLGAVLSMQFVLWQFPAFVPPQFSWPIYGMALACQWLALIMMLAISMLCFSFASQSFVALLLTVFIYLVGQNMELLRRVVVENTHAGILTGQEKLVIALSWIFPNLSLFDKKAVAAYGLAFSIQEFGLLVLYCLSYSALLLFFAVQFFNRKELA